MTNNNTEVAFLKYQVKGSDYHYRQVNKYHLFSFNLYLYTRYQKIIDLIKEELQKCSYRQNQSIKILDFGCGDGVLVSYLKKYFPSSTVHLYGIDLSDAALQVAKKNVPHAIFKKASVYQTDFPHNFFDVVISTDVIEHLKTPEKMLIEIKRIAKHQAVICVGTPIRVTEKPAKFHVYEFFPQEFLKLMKKYFTNCQIVESHDFFHLLMYQKSISLGKYHVPFYKYLYNFMFLLCGYNPFAADSTKATRQFSYMFVKGDNAKKI